jgi:hypothetical protein
VTQVEELGAEVLVHLDVDATAVRVVDQVVERSDAVVVARFGPDADVAKGDTIAVGVDTGRVHLFDVVTGASLAKEAG